ncbi:MAG TPA: F0F1 ATP synthase subunit A [Anaerovoracaceae bacterium]|nr:F0F1 ATP synthase subunit A [Anaerovoracaceae bacterium]
MHTTEHLGPRKIIGFLDGSIFITETVLFALIIAAIMIVFAFISTRKLERYPKGLQLVAELIVGGIYSLTSKTMGEKNVKFAPYIGTLFIFTMIGSAGGLFGLRPVTADINTAFALSVITFFLVQISSIKGKGFFGHLKHYGEPYPFMYPIKIIEDVALPVSMAFRLFGNITGGMIVMALTFQGLEALTKSLGVGIPIFQFLIPIPLNLFFDVFEPVLQSFIFTMLTMAFVSMATLGHDD